MDFSGRTIIVTGAAHGNGRTIAKHFLERGGTVIIADIQEDAANRTADELSSTTNGRAIGVGTDVTVETEVDALVNLVTDECGGIDILVNNAGIYQTIESTIDQSVKDWQTVMDVHVKGTYLCSKAALPHLTASSSGAIVNISSIAGMAAFPYRSAYSPAKAAISMLTKVLAIEVATDGVRVNAVAPGFVSKTSTGQRQSSSTVDRSAIEKRTPTGRLIEKSSVANAVVFLSSDLATDITGVVLPVDGGWTAYGFY